MKPEPIKDVVKSVISGWRKEAPSLNEEQILKVWRAAAGRRLARHSKPVSFRSPRLIVNVDSSGWLYELMMHRRRILKRLKKKFVNKPLEELQFRIGKI